jgi:hypothetical protein
LEKTLGVDDGVFHSALSSDGSQLVSLSEVFDSESGACLARLDFLYDLDSESLEKALVFFASDGKGISIKNLKSDGTKYWDIVLPTIFTTQATPRISSGIVVIP